MLDGACLYLSREPEGERYPVLWPAGTDWDAPTKSVISPTGDRMPIGSEVMGAGGYCMSGMSNVWQGRRQHRSRLDVSTTPIVIVNNWDEAICLEQG